jgi:hypothetical protein
MSKRPKRGIKSMWGGLMLVEESVHGILILVDTFETSQDRSAVHPKNIPISYPRRSPAPI